MDEGQVISTGNRSNRGSNRSTRRNNQVINDVNKALISSHCSLGSSTNSRECHQPCSILFLSNIYLLGRQCHQFNPTFHHHGRPRDQSSVRDECAPSKDRHDNICNGSLPKHCRQCLSLQTALSKRRLWSRHCTRRGLSPLHVPSVFPCNVALIYRTSGHLHGPCL